MDLFAATPPAILYLRVLGIILLFVVVDGLATGAQLFYLVPRVLAEISLAPATIMMPMDPPTEPVGDANEAAEAVSKRSAMRWSVVIQPPPRPSHSRTMSTRVATHSMRTVRAGRVRVLVCAQELRAADEVEGARTTVLTMLDGVDDGARAKVTTACG